MSGYVKGVGVLVLLLASGLRKNAQEARKQSQLGVAVADVLARPVTPPCPSHVFARTGTGRLLKSSGRPAQCFNKSWFRHV